ncbi:MAG: hypothetical protein METHAR1v1_310033 [Methanothrix sp.]|nr:MAG: hypothetical protein METHAR1v1_310033 [Methanothrix sp.]
MLSSAVGWAGEYKKSRFEEPGVTPLPRRLSGDRPRDEGDILKGQLLGPPIQDLGIDPR